jgi:hypothetical protein
MERDIYWFLGALFYLLMIAFFVWAILGNVNVSSTYDGWTPDYP